MGNKVAVVIINFNSGRLLTECLTRLRAQTVLPNEVIVMDNASEDGSAQAAVQLYPDTKLIPLSRNMGFAAANNLAIRQETDADWIALLNPDAFTEPSWLESLLRAAHKNPEYSFFGSHMLAAGIPEQVDGTGDIYHVSGLVWRRGHGRSNASIPMRTGDIFSPCAAAALYRREDILEAGGFDENFFCYLEDVDLGFRLRLIGRRGLYVPDAVVQHVGSAISGKRSLFTIYHGHRNLVWTYVKNMPWPLFWIYLPQHILLNIVTVVWFTLRGQGKIILKAKWDALRGLPRVWRQRKAIQSKRRITSWELRGFMSKGLLHAYILRRD